MSGFDKVFAALALAALLAACDGDDGDDESASPLDGGAPAVDAPVGPLEPLASPWRFELVPVAGKLAPDRTACDVMIGATGFDISCRPTQQVLPTSVGENCDQLLDDLHLSGSFLDRLEGVFDRRVEYTGQGCLELGFTTGSPYPLPVFATMLAQRTEARPVGDFLTGLAGSWTFSRRTSRDDLEGSADCAVELDASLQPPSLGMTAECPEAWAPVMDGCERQDAVLVEATLWASELEGSVSSLVRHRGPTCGERLPPEAVTIAARLSASREPG